jgi:hypothetical protein
VSGYRVPTVAPKRPAPVPDPGTFPENFEDDLDARHRAELAEIDRLATLLDSQWRIPFISVRFGADVLAGLVPVAGDAASALVSAWLINRARKIGAPGHLVFQMTSNVVLDAIAGSIPILGTVIDVFYKANRRNIALLRGHMIEAHAKRKAGASAATTHRKRS